MTRSLVAASWRAVARSALFAPVGIAVLLTVGTATWLDSGSAVNLLRGAALLLAAGLVTTVDDPSGEVLAASPYPLAVRTASRILVGLAVVVPAWLAVVVLVTTRVSEVPTAALTLEALGMVAVGLALATGLRRWRGQHQPSYVSGPGLFLSVLALNAVPPRWAFLTDQTWGPPWAATHLRWAALSLAAFALMRLAMRDPLDS
jgi:fluoroquinolone transport system permease protein